MSSTSISDAGAKAGHIALSVPGLRSGSLGVAGRTALYPALSIGTGGVRTFLRASPDASVLRKCRRQILVVAEAPDERHGAFLQAASSYGCPTLVVLWGNSLLAELLPLAAGVDPALVKLADPRGTALPDGDQHLIRSGFLVPARADLDTLLLAKFPSLNRPTGAHDGAAVAAFDPWVTVVAADIADLARIAPMLSRTLRAPGSPPLLIVAPNPAEFIIESRHLGLTASVLDEGDTSWLGCLRRSRAVLVPSSANDPAPGTSLNGAIWVLTALRAGVPVIADANPLLDSVAGGFISDDWERGLSLYVESASSFRAADAAIGQARTVRVEQVNRALKVDRNHPWLWEGVPFRLQARSERPVLLTFLDLPQDLDVLLPVLQALRRKDQFRLRVCVTDWLRKEAPRTFTMLQSEGFVPEVVEREQAINAAAPALEQVDALLAASETNQGPHRAGHALAKRAVRAGIPTFTLQHGFENIGLTYKDALFGANVCFASRHIFVWVAAENLPTWVSADTFSRIISTGSPKTTPPPCAAHPLPDLGSWSCKIGLFENLHWHRFSETYRRELFADLDMAAERSPDTLFLIKPHSAGRWLVNNLAMVPRRENIRVIDPLQAEWQIFTAPALIQHMDAVITTPSTVAVDAARAGRPVAVVGNDLDLPLYEPLPVLSNFDHWCAFLDNLTDVENSIARNEIFLRKNFLPYAGQWRMADAIYTVVMARRLGQPQRDAMALPRTKIHATEPL